MSRLCSRSLKRSELPSLQALIEKLVHHFYVHHPSNSRSSNFHQLLHLPAFAQQYGNLLVTSSYPVENMMGKIAAQAKTGTRVAEQILNKMSVNTSLNILMETTIFDEGTLEFLKKQKLLEKKAEDVDIVENKFKEIVKVRLGSSTFCPEVNSLQRKCDDHLLKLKDGRFVSIFRIFFDEAKNVIFDSIVFDIRPFIAQFDGQQYQFEHVKIAKLNSSKLAKFSISDIDRPIAQYKANGLPSNECLIFELFNRHA